MDKEEELYREMNEEDDFYMGDRDEEEEEPDDDDPIVGCIWLVLMLTIIVTMVAC